MRTSNRGHIVSNVARKTVSAFLELIDKPDELLDGIGPIAIQFERLGFEAIPALSEVLGHEDRRARDMAAWFVLRLAADCPQAVADSEVIVRSGAMLTKSLRDGDVEERLWSLLLLSFGGVPNEAVGTLRDTLNDPDERLRVFAAAALTWCDDGATEGLSVLGEAMGHKNATIVATAVAAYARLGLRNELVEQIILSFPAAGPESQHGILRSLREIGPPALAAAEILERLIDDRKAHPALRGAAASALGSITRGTKRGQSDLKKALGSADYRVVAGAIEGFAALGDFPDAAVQRCAALLSVKDDDEIRKTAAMGLKLMRGRAASAVPALIHSATEERSIAVLEVMLKALAAIGPPALPWLVELLKEDDFQKVAVANGALMQMGTDAAVALAALLKNESDDCVRTEVVRTLREMGSGAAPAVPVLAEMLDEAADPEAVAYIVVAILATGSGSAAATPALIRCLTNRSDEAGYWAERALWSIGPSTIPLLEAALQSATGQARRRIESALAGMRSVAEQQFERFFGIPIEQLKDYLRAAEVLVERGPTSWPKMSSLLEERGVHRSASILRTNVKRVEEALKMPLTDSKNNRKGGLTPQGRAIIDDLKKYIATIQENASDA